MWRNNWSLLEDAKKHIKNSKINIDNQIIIFTFDQSINQSY